MRLSASNLGLSYPQTVVATDLSIEIPDSQITALIGPNGSGKSTLLRALSRLLRPTTGQVILDGEHIERYSTKEVARRLAILPQVLTHPESTTVEELVAYGRFPQRRSIGGMSSEDRVATEWALEVTAMIELRARPVDHLSGGQRQRAWIALVLAQGTDLILLDEPTTFLDLAYQLEVLELLKRLNSEQGKTMVMVLHDVNMACEYSHNLIALRNGKLIAQGEPRDILTADLIRDVFGIDAHILEHPSSGAPICVPIPPRRTSTSPTHPSPFRPEPWLLARLDRGHAAAQAMRAGEAGPLRGVRVLDLTRIVSGAQFGVLLGDMGADVIKVERPGTATRFATPPGPTRTGVPYARNKRSITLDLAKERGREILFELVERADVLAENFAPGGLERFVGGPDALLMRNPKLVIVRISGWGQTGPRATEPGFGTLAEAFAGDVT